MEGLLPLVLRAVKKNQTRRRYQRLPSGASSSSPAHHIPLINMESHAYQHQTHNNYSVIEYYNNEDNNNKRSSSSRHSHRRHKSVGDFAFGMSKTTSSRANPEQLVRFRSQRMFSCITGL